MIFTNKEEQANKVKRVFEEQGHIIWIFLSQKGTFIRHTGRFLKIIFKDFLAAGGKIQSAKKHKEKTNNNKNQKNKLAKIKHDNYD